ncbi:MAG: hypothetical protein A2700_01615 [Candidatus Blackburnbacteria bacterium RIFCSPHIGHO2_01_FULL_44_64]|uniref:VanZ-like domain-containing protein n=1 Tax=Candidatus Blackburnbacteria bacterium RIFCSPHIGHO2_02_FULL_44_20 TaxID=1797516 RepID=A0A1G1V9A0_9BACT|nr:MAG: hypothetical protein A2700_01615 [Candidatus Blackburnbacteria bacterium RIFCSPHIGHO2_01_FULL_44_64]OGY11244.1 MAG: hypothetical protein A3E16_01595 [Candidatus Blackburnbacteria bacterium RIFCSPHIGHO2_12_FULL_44_25]OGY11933.1 MAG: hypothetical protein A3D26_03005 [Candidatus Blackburnbacteria bacterium RIFCSPHIGHO2_02_FULL_44_20]
MKAIKYWLPPIIWAGLIFYLSSLTPGSVSGPAWLDFIIKKGAHITEYGILFVLLYRALFKTVSTTKRKLLILTLIGTILYAGSDEYHQSFVPGRHAALMDVGFDSFGGIISMFAVWKYLPKAPKKLKNLAKSLELL